MHSSTASNGDGTALAHRGANNEPQHDERKPIADDPDNSDRGRSTNAENASPADDGPHSKAESTQKTWCSSIDTFWQSLFGVRGDESKRIVWDVWVVCCAFCLKSRLISQDIFLGDGFRGTLSAGQKWRHIVTLRMLDFGSIPNVRAVLATRRLFAPDLKQYPAERKILR